MSIKKYKRRLIDMALLTLLVLTMALPGLAGLQVIDRDEARYTQATVQMIETGDYINIRFQDRARNKKPAGAYWAQAASVNAFSDVNKRPLWAHRLPSVLAAILAVLATYWGGARMLGRDVAIISAALLAVSFVLVFEAHIAKTDALLCGFSALTLACLGHLRNGGGRRSALLFWFALGCAVMIKGPLLPILVVLTIVSLLLWERRAAWLKPLLFIPGPLLFLLIILPWGILIWQETNGAFFSDALGDDFGSKLIGAKEQHGAPPGYYTLSIWLSFWPGSLFLLPGIAFAVRAAKNKALKDTAIANSVRLLLAWTVPFWILLELTPTKLLHYPLPIFPALALMSGAAVITLSKVKEFPFLRRVGSFIFLLVSIALAGGVLFAQSYYGDFPTWSFVTMGIAIILAFLAVINLWTGKGRAVITAAILSAMVMYVPTYQFILPNLHDFRIANQVKTTLLDNDYQIPLSDDVQVFSPHFKEPSLIYNLGTKTMVGQADKRLTTLNFATGDLVIIDRALKTTKEYELALAAKLTKQNICLQSLTKITGTNYSKGDRVILDILKLSACAAPTKQPEEQATKPDP